MAFMFSLRILCGAGWTFGTSPGLERPPDLFSLLTHDSFRVLRFRLLQASSDGGLSTTALHLKRHGVGDVGIGEDVELLAAIGLRRKSQIDAPDGACLE